MSRTNAAAPASFGTWPTIPAQTMAVYDGLPAEVRAALAVAPYDMSAEAVAQIVRRRGVRAALREIEASVAEFMASTRSANQGKEAMRQRCHE